MAYFLGIDIGGTGVKLGVVDSIERITLYETSIRTRVTLGADAIVEDIISASKEIQKKYDIERVGIGSAGRIDRENGIVITAGNLPFRNTPLAQLISDALGVPAMLDNDGNCAVIGEYLAGVARGKKDVDSILSMQALRSLFFVSAGTFGLSIASSALLNLCNLSS